MVNGRRQGLASVTITDVAVAAHVSRSTVSRVFSRPDLLRPETVERVKRIAADLGYVPNPSAKALSTGTMSAIGLVVPDIANPFFPPLIRSVGARATELEIAVLIADTEENPAREAAALGLLTTRTDGVVLASSRQTKSAIVEWSRRIPLVLVNRDIAGIPRVLVDTGRGVGRAVEHLAELGHTRIAYVVGPRHSWSNRERRRAILQAAQEFGLQVTLIKGFGPTYDDGMRSAAPVLASGATAMIAFDDLMAQGAMAGFVKAGIDVPGEMSVVGCDSFLATKTYPQLTSVQSRSEEAGPIAVELLLGTLDPHARVVISGDLVIRETTAPPGRRTLPPHPGTVSHDLTTAEAV